MSVVIYYFEKYGIKMQYFCRSALRRKAGSVEEVLYMVKGTVLDLAVYFTDV